MKYLSNSAQVFPWESFFYPPDHYFSITMHPEVFSNLQAITIWISKFKLFDLPRKCKTIQLFFLEAKVNILFYLLSLDWFDLIRILQAKYLI